MSTQEIKLECLKLAVALGSKDDKTALDTAKKIYEFLNS